MFARLWFLVDRRALLVTGVCIGGWRLLDQIPVTDIRPAFMTTRLELLTHPGFLGAIGSGSVAFGAYSIGVEGIGPYVNALIILSLAGVVSSSVRTRFLTAHGRVSLTRWARAVALLLALGQAYGLTVLAQNVGALPPVLDWSGRLLVSIEVTAGTAVMILLAAAMDEFGLGFGYAAFIFYALGSVAAAVHRVGDLLSTAPSLDATSKSLFFGSAWTVAACAACVAVVLATGRVVRSSDGNADREQTMDMPILASGVFRPSQFAFAVMFLPTLAANYYVSTNPAVTDWVNANWAPLGPTPWVDAIYVAVESILVVLFAVMVAIYDRSLAGPELHGWAEYQRLAVIGGACVALLVVVVPIVARLVEARIAMVVPLGGFSLLIVVATLMIVIRAVEHRPATVSSLIP